jgi:hypothetical protein
VGGTYLEAILFPNSKKVTIFGKIVTSPNCIKSGSLGVDVNIFYDLPRNFCPVGEIMLASRDDPKQQINIEPAHCRIFVFPPTPGGREFLINSIYDVKVE